MFCKDSEWTILFINNDDRTVRALVNQADCFTKSVLGSQRNGSLEYGMPRFHMLDDSLDDVERNILRQDHKTSPTRNSFCHAATSHCSHVGYHDGYVRSDLVGCAEVDIEPGRNIRHGRNHEDIVVCQVVRGSLL